MRRVNTVTVLVAAGLMASAVATAAAPSLPWQVSGGQDVSVVRDAGLDWTALIGTGGAAAVEAGAVRSNEVAPVRVQSYAKPDWTATIGRGTAAARPIS